MMNQAKPRVTTLRLYDIHFTKLSKYLIRFLFQTCVSKTQIIYTQLNIHADKPLAVSR
jgi:hypothetical protein